MTQQTKGAGTLRRAVRSQAFDRILGGRHMECAYYYVDGTWNVPTTMVDGTWNVPTTLVDGTWNVPTTLTYVGGFSDDTTLTHAKLLRMRMMSGTSWF